MKMIENLNGYLLHRRNFRDTSVIVQCFTREMGVISVIAKGAKRPKSKLKPALQFFTPLLLSCYGKSDLLGLKQIDILANDGYPKGKSLFVLLYANELLVKLLNHYEPHQLIYEAYETLLEAMIAEQPIELSLRKFEAQVLQDLGYGLALHIDSCTGQVVNEESYYQFSIDDGVSLYHGLDNHPQKHCWLGSELIRIQQQEFTDKQVLQAAKRLFRRIFSQLLNYQPLHSRLLFSQSFQKDSLTKVRGEYHVR